MKTIKKASDVKRIQMTHPEVKDAYMKVLIGPNEGWDDYVMRQVELEAFGYSPKHAHPWPHINLVISGVGEIEMDGEVTEVTVGDSAFIPENTLHQFRNKSEEAFRFVCIVPKDGHQ